MSYTINQVAKMLGITTATIRYYDKEGLLPNLERRESGYRIFYDYEIETLKFIQIFKRAGMQIQEIKQYINLFMEGEITLEDRQKMLLTQKENLVKRRQEIEESMKELDSIIEFNQSALTSDAEKQLRDSARELIKRKEEEKNEISD